MHSQQTRPPPSDPEQRTDLGRPIMVHLGRPIRFALHRPMRGRAHLYRRSSYESRPSDQRAAGMRLQGAIECPNSYKRGPPAGPGRTLYRVALRYVIPVLRGAYSLLNYFAPFWANFGCSGVFGPVLRVVENIYRLVRRVRRHVALKECGDLGVFHGFKVGALGG